MEERIDCPAYIVLDIPSPTAEWIQSVRKRFDEERSLLPAEITLTGSSGTGLIVQGQSVREISELLDRAAEKIHPFYAEFGTVQRFENTDIYFLDVKDPSPFELAHEIVSSSGIGFEESPYPFRPHCTLKLRKPPATLQELLELFFLQAPKEPFLLDRLSIPLTDEQAAFCQQLIEDIWKEGEDA